MFAIQEINKNLQLLPNITLGFHILNNYYIERISYKAMLNLLSSQQKFVPNFNCDATKTFIAAIGGRLTETSTIMANILGNYKIAQVGPWNGSLKIPHF